MNWSERSNSMLREAGELSSFAGRFFVQAPRVGSEFSEFIRQCFRIGYQSLPLIGLTGFIMGLVLTMQLRPSMVEYGVESQLPSMISIAIVREMGPVITALIFAGKIGSSIGAELGSMRVTEQIDAMEVSGTNPFRYLVVTRVLATTFMLPVLVLLSDAISLYGSFLGVNIRGATSFSLFYYQVTDILSFGDVLPAFIKTFFFGYAVGTEQGIGYIEYGKGDPVMAEGFEQANALRVERIEEKMKADLKQKEYQPLTPHNAAGIQMAKNESQQNRGERIEA